MHNVSHANAQLKCAHALLNYAYAQLKCHNSDRWAFVASPSGACSTYVHIPDLGRLGCLLVVGVASANVNNSDWFAVKSGEICICLYILNPCDGSYCCSRNSAVRPLDLAA